eukprot:TRINITY_DN12347_c0_g1_i1.p1 TRINITY_DN12347_c0_g1~~TRINITY_DN12347_c0_g1_i1.p1  ORF type:complete len:802 (+),score=164.46 TRINITY_DN12347_c0_g1_i1:327-2408(+)
MKAANGATIVLLDTEGFFATNVPESFDAKVFALSALISSRVLYTSIRTIDQSAVDYLELLTKRTQLFSLKNRLSQSVPMLKESDGLEAVTAAPPKQRAIGSSSETEPSWELSLPALSWIVQDFVQDLEGRTPQQWLQSYIAKPHRDPGLDDSETDVNSVFDEVSCFILPPPSGSVAQLRDLSKQPLQSLAPSYLAELNKLRSTLWTSTTASASSDGASIADAVTFLIESLQSAAFPQLPSLWRVWTAQRAESAAIDALRLYTSRMQTDLSADPVLSAEQLAENAKLHTTEASQLFGHALMGFAKTMSQRKTSLMKQLQTEFEHFNLRNDQRVSDTLNTAKDNRNTETHFTWSKLSLPLPTSIIEAQRQELIRLRTSEFDSLKLYKSNGMYEPSRKAVLEYVKTECNRVLLENSKEITSRLKNSRDHSVSAFSALLEKAVPLSTFPVGENEIKDACAASKVPALDELASHCESVGLGWLQKEDAYKATRALAAEDMATVCQELVEKNEKKMQSTVTSSVKSAFTAFKKQCDGIYPRPDLENTISGKMDGFAKEALEYLERACRRFKTSAPVLRAIEDLRTQIAKQRALVLKANVKRIRIDSEDIFDCAKNILAAEDCTLCFRMFFGYSQRNAALAAADRCSKTIASPFSSSPMLWNKVVEDFVEKEIKPQTRWFVLIGIIVASVGGYVALVNKK